MTETAFLDGRVVLHPGDCRDVIRSLPDASIDSVVTDPPYALVSIVKRFANSPRSEATENTENPYGRTGRGFMGQRWDNGETAFASEFWGEVLRVLKPGGHVVAFSGTRTYHRIAVAIEDAGFEIRDQLAWVYGAGFPKSYNVSRRLDGDRCACEGPTGIVSDLQRDLRPMRRGHVSPAIDLESQCGEVLLSGMSKRGASRTVRGAQPSEGSTGSEEQCMEGWGDAQTSPWELRSSPLHPLPPGPHLDGTPGWLCDGASSGDGKTDRAPAASDGVRSSSRPSATEQRSDELRALAGQSEPQACGAWPHCSRCGKPIVPDGLGTALKPAWEPIVLARKPLSGTVAETVLAHGTGALNIDGCRVETDEDRRRNAAGGNNGLSDSGTFRIRERRLEEAPITSGRWPANIVHDGSDEVIASFPSSDGQRAAVGPQHGAKASVNTYGDFGPREHTPPRGDTGSAARFFYSAKADANDRIGSKHPTVKPVDLMQWLCRLVTPPGGTVLDPFAGTGTTGEAAFREGFKAVLIEREEEYRADIARRMELALAGPDERARESLKARGKADYDAGPLFSGGEAA